MCRTEKGLSINELLEKINSTSLDNGTILCKLALDKIK